ncbi:MAG: RNA polymerase sigma factor region1.1 domain-containing protein, partial [Aurantimonas coralicida]
MAIKAKESEAPIEERNEGAPDGPLLDLSDDAVKKMIKAAKKRGFVTMDKLNSMLSAEDVTSEQIEDMMTNLNDMGINVVESDEEGENEEQSESSESTEVAETGRTQVATTTKKEAGDRTDDPVRMYLR